jgi:4-amino-4-deoxy-L-arabinose transferase-like glycosyltransferase
MMRHRLVLLVVLYAAAFRLVTINRPFYYSDEATGSFYGVLARNYLRFELKDTRGIPVESVAKSPDGSLFFYPDHPPLVPWLIVPVYWLFGVGEWQTRLPTSVATVAAVYVLYSLLRRYASERLALLASVLFATMPMNLYFGGMPEVVGMPLVVFVMLSVSAYMALQERPDVQRCLRLIAVFTLAALSDWPAFVLVPVLTIHWLTTCSRRLWPWIIVFGVFACATLALLSSYIAWATDAPWNWMVPLFARRAAIGRPAPFTVSQWLSTALAFNRHMHTLPILIASAFWLLSNAFGADRRDRGSTIGRLLLAFGIVHVVLGRQGVFNHEWWWSPLTPGLAVATALLLDRYLTLADRRQIGGMAQALVAALVLTFAVWTSAMSLKELFPNERNEPFTTVDLGAAIRVAAPEPNDVALLVWSGSNPELWFYGDRALRANVWSIDDFTRRRDDTTVDVMFDEVQSWQASATGLVFPTVSRHDFADLRAHVQRRYPLASVPADIAAKFDIFDLRHPLTPDR